MKTLPENILVLADTIISEHMRCEVTLLYSDTLVPLDAAARAVRTIYGDDAILAAIEKEWRIHRGTFETPCGRCIMAEIAESDYQRPVPQQLLAKLAGVTYGDMLRNADVQALFLADHEQGRDSSYYLAESRKQALACCMARIINANDFVKQAFLGRYDDEPRQAWIDTFFPEGIGPVNSLPAGALQPS